MDIINPRYLNTNKLILTQWQKYNVRVKQYEIKEAINTNLEIDSMLYSFGILTAINENMSRGSAIININDRTIYGFSKQKLLSLFLYATDDNTLFELK